MTQAVGAMQRLFFLVFFAFFAHPASAQDCPAFYRFVDFGLADQTGTLYRGGPTLRAEDFNGEPLLVSAQTTCLPINDVAKDGHGNPIPVVSQIYYDPLHVGAEINELTVSRSDDIETAISQNAAAHKANLANADAAIMRGQDFLCVTGATPDALSCQLVSPFKNTLDLVVYCDGQQCSAPLIAATEHLAISALWKTDVSINNDTAEAGSAMVQTIRKIHDFLKPLSAVL